MIAITHFRDTPDEPVAVAGPPVPAGAEQRFAERAEAALAALAARPGYVRGTLARSLDDPGDWLMLTEWESVGAYRRALGGFEVKMTATPLLAQARDLPGGFESLLDISPGGQRISRSSDRDETGLGRIRRST
jgi:quinol monooxygenase YgiN